VAAPTLARLTKKMLTYLTQIAKANVWVINKKCGKSKEGGVSFQWAKRKKGKETPP
jgi:hypothetical protein